MSRNGSHARVLKPRPLSTQSSRRRNESSIGTYSNINTGGFFVLKINPVNTFTRATSNCASLFIYFSLFRSNGHNAHAEFCLKIFIFFFEKKLPKIKLFNNVTIQSNHFLGRWIMFVCQLHQRWRRQRQRRRWRERY